MSPLLQTEGRELCNNHTAAGERFSKADPAKDVRGILSVACARHGCMLPGGTVDVPLAEKYWNPELVRVPADT